jgi:competence protein ComEC
MKQPLTVVALLYLAGLLLGHFCPLPLNGLFGLALGLAGLALVAPSRRQILLAALICVTGWTNLTWRDAVISPHDLRLIFGDQAELVAVRGTLRATPTQRVFQQDDQEIWRSLARVEVSAVRRKNQWQSGFGEVMVSTPGLLPGNFFAGQPIEASGILRPPPGPIAEGLFDYRTYLRWQGIYYQLQVHDPNEWRLVREPSVPEAVPWPDRFQSWAKKTLARGLPIEDEELRLLWAMTLGWQTALTSEVSEPFMRSGTMHIFAISGLHIALIAGILVHVLRVFQMPRGWCGLIVIPAIWYYTAATGWQASAIRSTIMMSIVIAGWALKRPGDLVNSLAAAGLIILIWDPRELFQASFQLSFFVVLSIALLVPPIERVRQRLLKSDPLLPAELRPRWQSWLDFPIRVVTTSLATSLAAWLGALPLIAYYFHLVTPISLFANLLIVPLSSLALMSNLGSLLCGDWLPGVGELFNQSAWLWMHWMIGLSEWSVGLPAAYFYVRSPAPLGFLIYYLVLLAALMGWFLAPKLRLWTALGLLALAGIWGAQTMSDRATARLTVLPLSRGSAVFADAPGKANDLLVDCGNASSANLVVKPFLRGQGVNQLRQFVLTHGDLRQMGGADLIIREFSASQVLMSSVRFRSPSYRQVLEQLRHAPERRRQINRNDRAGVWRVLHPESRDHFAQADDNTLVFAGEFHDTRILLLSDLGKGGQNLLLQRESDLRADIVIAGWSHQNEPLGDALLDSIDPSVLIVCDAEYPAAARVSEPTRGRLARRKTPVVYTSENGAVTLALRASGWDLSTMNGLRLSGKAGSATR